MHARNVREQGRDILSVKSSIKLKKSKIKYVVYNKIVSYKFIGVTDITLFFYKTTHYFLYKQTIHTLASVAATNLARL